MSLFTQIEEFLPTRPAKVAALSTLAAVPIAWAIPHLASPLYPNATQLEVLFAQATLAASAIALGLLIVLALVMLHSKATAARLAEANQQLSALAQPGRHRNRVPIVLDPSHRMDPARESVLTYVTSSPGRTVAEIATALDISEPTAQHHLEWLQAHSYAVDSLRVYESGIGRYEWSCEAPGRTYLATHSLLR